VTASSGVNLSLADGVSARSRIAGGSDGVAVPVPIPGGGDSTRREGARHTIEGGETRAVLL
jgi:hypothetical protein